MYMFYDDLSSELVYLMALVPRRSRGHLVSPVNITARCFRPRSTHLDAPAMVAETDGNPRPAPSWEEALAEFRRLRSNSTPLNDLTCTRDSLWDESFAELGRLSSAECSKKLYLDQQV